MNQKAKKQLDTLKEEFVHYSSVDGSWTLSDKKADYTFHTKRNPLNDININRMEIDVRGVDFSKLEFYFGQLNNQIYIDPNFKCKEIQNDGEIQINYGVGKPPIAIVDTRDLLVATRIYKLGQLETLIIHTSITDPAHAQVPGMQRAEMIFNYIYLKQLSPNKVLFLSIAHFDPKGDIPKMLVNMMGGTQLDQIQKMIEYARTH